MCEGVDVCVCVCVCHLYCTLELQILMNVPLTMVVALNSVTTL